MAIKHLDLVDPTDQVLILDEGVSVEYGRFKDLATNENSRVLKFFKNKSDEETRKKERRKNVLSQFQKRVHRAISFNRVLERLATSSDKEETGEETETVKQSSKSSARLQKISAFQKKFEMKQTLGGKNHSTFLKYLLLFLSSAAPTETVLICRPVPT